VRRTALAVALVALATLPLWLLNSYYVNIASQMLLWAIFALGLNVMVGYAGLTSLGHAGLFGIVAYAAGWLAGHGLDPFASALIGIAVGLATSAVYAVLSLRTTGISFLMITLALGQVLWGIAYRWISVTGGDNGLNLGARPAPFGFSLEDPPAFYYASLVLFLAVVAAMFVFAASPLGAALRGTRDQARRMTTLGFNVWLTRFIAFLFSGLVTAIAGLLFLYYNKFVSPHALSLTTSAEVLLMVISGGTATLVGPIVGAVLVVTVKYVVSAYIERWNLVLGAIFVVIVMFMPEGLVPGAVRLWNAGRMSLGARLAAGRVRTSGESPP
jgi:branched-chain amino acid transport system permease protein